MVELGGKLYCPKCAAPKKKEVEANKKLASYLYELCDQERELMPFLMTQVKRLKSQYSFKTTGILATLKYVFELSEIPPVFKPEIGIESIVIKNYYFAKKYYEELHHLAKQSPEEIDSTLTAPVHEVHLDSVRLAQNNNFFKEKQKNLQYGPPIDLDSIPDDEGV